MCTTSFCNFFFTSKVLTFVEILLLATALIIYGFSGIDITQLIVGIMCKYTHKKLDWTGIDITQLYGGILIVVLLSLEYYGFHSKKYGFLIFSCFFRCLTAIAFIALALAHCSMVYTPTVIKPMVTDACDYTNTTL